MTAPHDPLHGVTCFHCALIRQDKRLRWRYRLFVTAMVGLGVIAVIVLCHEFPAIVSGLQEYGWLPP